MRFFAVGTPAVVLVGCAWLQGCASMDPEVRASTEYLQRLEPLLVENSLLAERVLIASASIYNEEAKPEELEVVWRDDIVLVAEHLHDQAGHFSVPELWVERHSKLVEIWADRAQAYRSLAEALHVVDAEQWKAARETANGVKLREEEWFRSVNQELAPRGMIVDQFP